MFKKKPSAEFPLIENKLALNIFFIKKHFLLGIVSFSLSIQS